MHKQASVFNVNIYLTTIHSEQSVIKKSVYQQTWGCGSSTIYAKM